jgi:hypothetical protein
MRLRRGDYTLQGKRAQAHGYEPIRADKLPEPGKITRQVIDHIVRDNLVIADLTDSNPNVFYELGICHAIRKPVILLMLDGQTAPFDLHEMRRISIHHYDQEIIVKAKIELEKQIAFVEQHTSGKLSTLHNPVAIPRELFLYAIRSIDAVRPQVGSRWKHLAGRWVGYLEQQLLRKEVKTERSSIVANVGTVEDTVSGQATITYVDEPSARPGSGYKRKRRRRPPRRRGLCTCPVPCFHR